MIPLSPTLPPLVPRGGGRKMSRTLNSINATRNFQRSTALNAQRCVQLSTRPIAVAGLLRYAPAVEPVAGGLDRGDDGGRRAVEVGEHREVGPMRQVRRIVDGVIAPGDAAERDLDVPPLEVRQRQRR